MPMKRKMLPLPRYKKVSCKTKTDYLGIVAANSFYVAQRVLSTFSRHSLVEGLYRSSFGSVFPTRRIPYILPSVTKKTSLHLISIMRCKISVKKYGNPDVSRCVQKCTLMRCMNCMIDITKCPLPYILSKTQIILSNMKSYENDKKACLI